MYGLDPAIGVSFIEGRELIQIAVGRHQVRFAFDKNVTISVEQKYECRFKGELATSEPERMDAAAAY